MLKSRVIGHTSGKSEGVAIFVAPEDSDGKATVLRITKDEHGKEIVEQFSPEDENIAEGLKIAEHFFGPDDPRLPSEITAMPIGQREDFVEEFNFQSMFYFKEDDLNYDENKPNAVNRVRFALEKAMDSVTKADTKDSETHQSLESITEDGVTYHRIKETAWGVFLPGDGTTKESLGDNDFSVTMIEQGWSLNNRYYSDGAINDFVELAKEQVVSFFNHGETFNRDPRDWGAMVTDPVREGVAAKAKLHIFDEPDGAFLRERISKAPGLFGLSVDAFAKVESGEAEGRKGTVVTEILRYNSLDVVMFPGAKGGFDTTKESVADPVVLETEDHKGDAKIMKLSELKEQHPDTYALLVAEVTETVQADVDVKLAEAKTASDELEGRLTEADKNLAEATAKVDEFEAKVAQAAFKTKVSEYIAEQLPEKAQTEKFAEICEGLGEAQWETIESMTQERKESFESGGFISEGEVKTVTEAKDENADEIDPVEKAGSVWTTAKTG